MQYNKSPVTKMQTYATQVSNIQPCFYQTSSVGSMTPSASPSPQANVLLNQQHLINPVPLDYEGHYRCNFIAQLQGSYEVDVSDGVEKIHVIMSKVRGGERQHAVVQHVCKDGQVCPEKLILEEVFQFKLCTINGVQQGVMMKGMYMRYSVEWTMNNGSKVIWRRTSDVVFNLVNFAPVVPPSSLSSVSSLSSGMYITGGETPESCTGHPNIAGLGYIRPELLAGNSYPQYKVTVNPIALSDLSTSSDESKQGLLQRSINLPSTNIIPLPVTLGDSVHEAVCPQCLACQAPRSIQDDFEEIKKHCSQDATLLKKLLKWGNNLTSVTDLTKDDLMKVSLGRIWLTASLTSEEADDEVWQSALDDLKGAYQVDKSESDIYIQPAPQQTVEGKLHRIRRASPQSPWIIEVCNTNIDSTWSTCVEELPTGQWKDHRFGCKVIEANMVPLLRILERMGDRMINENQKLEKCMHFLFKSCKQKLLSSKLRTRNLKHNIANLKVKLEKQNFLAFGVRVANTADKIAKE